MPKKISPEDLNPDLPESELSLSLHRNEKLAKNAQRHLEHDGRAKSSENTRPKRRSKRRSSDKGERHTRELNRNEEEPNEKQAHDAKKSKDNLKPKEGKSTDDFSVTRLDVIVFIVVLAQIIGCVAVGFEIYAYTLDQEWNSIVRGESPFRDTADHHVFKGKSFQFKGHVYLEKAAEYVMRDQPEEIAFMVIILLFVVLSFIHLCTCYIRAVDVEQYTVWLIALYASGGAICMFSSTFLVSASITIENGFTYAADMLHNFRFMNQDEPLSASDQDKCNKEYKNGCDYYEYAKLQALYLERIFRQCGSGSRFTRYYGTDITKTSVTVMDEIYFRSELKELGFCSRDGYKLVAAAFALLMGMLFAIVPVIFCCQGRAYGKRSNLEEEPESVKGARLQPEDEPKAKQDREKSREKGEGGERTKEKQPTTEKEARRRSTDVKAIVDEFRAYVEKDSEEEAPKVSTTDDARKVVGTKTLPASA